MKRGFIATMTIAACVVAAGFLMVPGLYNLSFDAGSMLEVDEDISSALELSSKEYMHDLTYPAYAETDGLTDEELEAFVGDMRSNDKGLVRLFEIIDQPYDDDILSFAQKVKGTDIYIIKTQARSNGIERDLAIAIKDLSPFFYKYSNPEKPSANSIIAAIDYLNSCKDGDMSHVKEYTGSIDYIFSEKMAPILIEMEPANDHIMELSPDEAGAIWSRCEGGSWEVHSDGADTVLVSYMDGYILTLYYDPFNQQFCGFNFIENSSRR